MSPTAPLWCAITAPERPTRVAVGGVRQSRRRPRIGGSSGCTHPRGLRVHCGSGDGSKSHRPEGRPEARVAMGHLRHPPPCAPVPTWAASPGVHTPSRGTTCQHLRGGARATRPDDHCSGVAQRHTCAITCDPADALHSPLSRSCAPTRRQRAHTAMPRQVRLLNAATPATSAATAHGTAPRGTDVESGHGERLQTESLARSSLAPAAAASTPPDPLSLPPDSVRGGGGGG